MRAVRGAIAVLLGATLVAVAPSGASADDVNAQDPFFLNWPMFAPAAPDGDHELSESTDCKNGKVKCVDRVIKEMTRRYNALGCDHDSMFAFTYLLTTEEYRRAVEDPDFFEDNAFVNHQDAVFAEYYFDQFDDWHEDRLEEVSPAWRIAFHAAEGQEVTGMGNVLLGMNAHVNRDLPFVLAEIGLVKPDGTSRKADHDRVNDFLAAVNRYLLPEAAQVLDPTVDDGDVPGTSLDNDTMVQLLVSWREQAWRNAERLVAAETDADREAVAEEIEEMAAYEALMIRESHRYDLTHDLLGTAAEDRDAFCAANFVER